MPLQKLVACGHAYPCFCTGQRLDTMRKLAAKAGRDTRYDRHCLHLSPEDVQAKKAAGEPHVLRLRVPEGETRIRDLVYGEVEVSHAQVDDQVLLKSDGFPTYHLASVVDDSAMEVSHVIRGEEWLNSTAKHLILYRLLGLEPPQFAHLPLLLNEDRTKLSKRHGGGEARHYRSILYPRALSLQHLSPSRPFSLPSSHPPCACGRWSVTWVVSCLLPSSTGL